MTTIGVILRDIKNEISYIVTDIVKLTSHSTIKS
jgi:hypothetical protein